MPDVTSSSTPRVKRTPDYSTHAVFKFPPANISPYTTGQEFENQREEMNLNINDNCDVNSNPVLHGRVVETINRHLLNSNCGKDGDEDCYEPHNNRRFSPSYSRTVTNIVHNSPDLISDINTHRFYKSDEDYDNGNHFHFQSSPRLDNSQSSFDSNCKSPQTPHAKFTFQKLYQPKPSLLHIESPKLFPGENRKPPPTPPARHTPLEISDPSTQQPRIPIKITVNPPEPPPRPTPSNKTPALPLEQPKSSLKAKMGSMSSVTKTVFGSPKVSRKKNPLLAKRRSVSVKELGNADNEGWLYRRLRIGDSGAQWIKGWFILKGTTFYGFKSREAPKADCFISLPGFTTSTAEEVKSRKFAFKVYHTGTVFYFAAESEEELAQWLDCLSMATIDVNTLKTSAAEGAVFSETEDEADDEPEVADSCFPSPKMRKFTNFLSGHSNHSVSGSAGSPKPARSHQNLASTADSKTYDIQKRFGSLKKLGYRSKYSNQLSSQSSSSATSLSSTEQSQDVPTAPHSLDRKVLRFLSTSKNPVPVPTSQFKSYRRVVATEPCPPFPKHADGISSGRGDEASSPHAARNMSNTHGEQDLRRNNRVTGRDEVSGTLTLEQFMLLRQEEERQQHQQSSASHHQERFKPFCNTEFTLVAYTGYTEDPVLSRHKSLEKHRSPPPAPPPLSPSPHQLPVPAPAVRPVPAARTILPAPAQCDTTSEPPAIVPRTSRPANDAHEPRASLNIVKRSPDSTLEATRRAPLPTKQPGLKNAAMYQPPPVAFSPSPSFGPSFEMHLDQRGCAMNSSDEIWDGSLTKGASSKIRQFLSPKRSCPPTPHGQFTPSNQSEASAPTPHRTILGMYLFIYCTITNN
ncbi:hypothetical protein ONE63_006834 [Megalurothrips usitatus]|uniref:PH domain-containing protein n=1 Tax=Megalurothrips usitatus TaxID=439358 RepID=A0AAV7XQ51_9NEOP|nr:hypothetical protein ONE63_006834 [Megalurothrips usitatus]